MNRDCFGKALDTRVMMDWRFGGGIARRWVAS